MNGIAKENEFTWILLAIKNSIYSHSKTITMPAETKTKGMKLETTAAPSLWKKFKNHCRKLNVSMAQRIRDLIQKDLKGGC